MPRSDRERLEDALGAARAALAFASGLRLADLQADARTLAALKYVHLHVIPRWNTDPAAGAGLRYFLKNVAQATERRG